MPKRHGSEVDVDLQRVQEFIEGREDLHDAQGFDNLGVLRARLAERLKLRVADGERTAIGFASETDEGRLLGIEVRRIQTLLQRRDLVEQPVVARNALRRFGGERGVCEEAEGTGRSATLENDFVSAEYGQFV
jgi:hypothetical protein